MPADLRHVRFQGMPAVRAMPLPASAGGGLCAASLASARLPSDATLNMLARMVLTRAGLNPDNYRPAPASRRVNACLRALKVASEADARAAIMRCPELAATALDTLLIGVSSFFRDPPVFETLRARIIPSLASSPAPIRVLSVGCSHGGEIYSMAMLFAEAGLLGRARLLGIDCRPQAISEARAGLFGDQALNGLDEARRTRYLEPVAGAWRVVGALRRHCEWAVADATRTVPAGPWDVVVCRNLAIYLEPSAGAALFARLAEALTPAGCLIVGKAERPPATLDLAPVGRCVYRRHDYA